ncbi:MULTISPECIES: sugar transferase [unclassified Modestobacter]|uniref:sugar transferase n=1 Tax=unclassified Modestobacter TaxID=2643866 RepID=UPI0022AB2F92|nr:MULTISPECIES: sugar transferase [unclassified Modestobacter]MCZ2825557.1 sugar transferase [Modestobacter sp. VKM Ac-2981]MCZ2853378.1 sugar transferase [Modestobacter sp. VKM Ac-2982]
MLLLEAPDELVEPRTGVVARRRFWSVARLRGEGTAARRAWRKTYVRRILLGDTLVAVLAALVGRLLPEQGPLAAHGAPWPVVVLPLVWVAAMAVGRSYEERFLWVGPEEFRRVFFSAVLLLASVGTVSWAFKLEVARSFVVVALPLATVLGLLQRYAQRSWLHHQRTHGRFQQTAILVGHRNGTAELHAQLVRQAQHGLRVIGVCLPSAPPAGTVFDGLPVLGGFADIADVVRRYEVDTVAVLPSPELDGAALRRLGWDLETTEAELLLAPAVTEFAGPRVGIRPVNGLPLMHLERPEFRGLRRVTKDVFDRSVALAAVVVLLPVLLMLAVAVKTTSRGPVFFRHERIGRAGQPFHVLKFRSMVPDADQRMAALMAQNEGNAVQFKMKRDPRVTRVGAVMRRWSLDELPQLLNVVGGTMSLVGPRPHVTREVEQYGFDMRRRLLVKPGITGLWQVSGRSDLSWDDSVRIDVRYVENWSLALDLMILGKTLGAVVRGSGAY